MSFKADQFAVLLAQKLATSLMLDNFTADKLPYLVVLSGDKSTKTVKKINETDKLGWLLNPEKPLLPADVMAKLSQTTVRFDMVETYNASYTGNVTQHKMFSGDVVTDNMNLQNPVYNLQAKVSHTSTLSSHSVAETVDILKEAFFLKFPVYLSLPDITNVDSFGGALTSYGADKDDIYGLITSLDVSRDSSIQDGFNISLTITQTKFAETIEASDTVGLVTEVPKLSAIKKLENALPDLPNNCSSILFHRLGIFSNGRGDYVSPEELGRELESVKFTEGEYANGDKCPVSELVNGYRNVIKEAGGNV